MSELLPCPFCGGTAFRGENEDENGGGSYIQCEKCSASTALHFERRENLVSSWNERVVDPSTNRLRERLQAIIDWADLALANPKEFDSHGVRNLTGPAFDEARAALAQVSA